MEDGKLAVLICAYETNIKIIFLCLCPNILKLKKNFNCF